MIPPGPFRDACLKVADAMEGRMREKLAFSEFLTFASILYILEVRSLTKKDIQSLRSRPVDSIDVRIYRKMGELVFPGDRLYSIESAIRLCDKRGAYRIAEALEKERRVRRCQVGLPVELFPNRV
jgi:hypothetical protein